MVINSNYFKNVIALYESAKEKEAINEAGEMMGQPPVDQSQIADQGSDLAPQGQAMPQDPSMMGGDPMMQDPSMMGGMAPDMGAPQQDSSLVLDKQKFVKLYTLFENLLDYSISFIETVDTIDQNLIPLDRLMSVRSFKENIESLNEKINDYMINIFNTEDYEKALYSYIVFRTELVTNIKGFRNILDLNKPDEEFPENDKNKSKK